jgi:hypothetical protein
MILTKNKAGLCILLSIVVISTLNAVVKCDVSDLPPPPVKPEKFTSRHQLKEYLIKLHEYYAIIGRPRFGRSQQAQKSFISKTYDKYENSMLEQLRSSDLNLYGKNVKVGKMTDNNDYSDDIFKRLDQKRNENDLGKEEIKQLRKLL